MGDSLIDWQLERRLAIFGLGHFWGPVLMGFCGWQAWRAWPQDLEVISACAMGGLVGLVFTVIGALMHLARRKRLARLHGELDAD